jgi:AraC family transcriptional activator of pobA
MLTASRSVQLPVTHFGIYPIGSLPDQFETPCPDNRQCHILWTRSGQGFFIAGTHTYAIANNTAYCFGPGQLKQIINTGITCGYFISLPPEQFYIAGSEFNFSFFPGTPTMPGPVAIPMDEETVHDTEDILVRIQKEAAAASSPGDELLRHLFKLFLLYLSRQASISAPSPGWAREFQLVKAFMGLLAQRFTTKKMVSDYAGELNITPGYLNLVVKRVSGFTASYHIQQQVVAEAKKRLMHTGCSMKEIAYDLGFEDTAHFSKFFKNNSGVNFTHFKKEVFYVQGK